MARPSRTASTTPATPAGPGRRRRTPEAAREEILSAADRLFRAQGPRAVGLKQIAAEAGVTHGLVTHYFGTFEQLVRAVWKRRNQLAAATVLEKVVAVRRGRAQATTPDDGLALEGALGAFVFEYLSDPYRAELFCWLRANGDPASVAEERGFLLGALVDFAERELAAARARTGRPIPPRARLEAAVLLVLAAGLGWSLGREQWLTALSRPVEPAADAGFQAALWTAVRALLAEGPG